MTKEEVKDKTNELIISLLDYINATDLTINEKQEISMELGISLITVTIDMNQSRDKFKRELLTKMMMLTEMVLTQSNEDKILKRYDEVE